VFDLIAKEVLYWDTPRDSFDKISAKNLAIVCYVLLESGKQLQSK